MVALALALLVSGVCTWLVSRRMTTQAAAPRQLEVHYVAPLQTLQAGEVLSAVNLAMVDWPASTPLDGAFSRTADIFGRAILFPLSKGQPILERDLSAAGSGTGLASKIPDGMRAVALRSDEVVGVAGFLVPGSRVDVLGTFQTGRLAEPVTSTVVQNALVIAAGHQIEPDPEGKNTAVTVVTLLLSPQESQRAVLASAQGAIHFVLRNGADAARTADTGTTLSELSGGQTATPAVARTVASAAPAAPKTHEIETVLGGDGGNKQ
jgi:pilus assembly protein CpaB